MKNLVSTKWLEKNLKKVRILDGTWHMPASNRDALKEFSKNHIRNANFFDLDKYSDQSSSLPHMLPSKDCWKNLISNLGIKNSDHVIIYDDSDIISSCRTWYNFLYFGHNPDLISVLDGGLSKWKKEKKEMTKQIQLFPKSSYNTKENKYMVVNKHQVDKNIKNKTFELIDARSKERFQGSQPESRKELKSGNIIGSRNIPFTMLINKIDNTFKKKEELKSIFRSLELDVNKDFAFTCGSGVTACILGLANSIINGKNPIIYDGSWCEYGLK